MPFILFTEQEKQSANASDIRSFLASHGQEVKRSGREYTWESPSGKVSINGSEWYSQYERVGGGAISFVQKFFGASYPDAVRSLLGSHAGQAPTDQNGTFRQSKSKETQTELVLPEKSADMRRLYGYLLNERCLDRDVVHAFVHEGFLYEDVPNHNAVFIGTDENGKPICTPIKSSLIGKRFGFEGVEKRIAYNAQEFRAKRWQPKIRNDVALAMHGCRGNREEFVRLLGSKGIDVVFRENDAGRIYGVTFIDHHNREVYNGSRLGKEFSANNFEKLFNSQGDIPWVEMPQGFSESHSLSSADLESGLEQAFGIFSFDAPANDPQEEMLAKQYQKKKKKKKTQLNVKEQNTINRTPCCR